MVLVVVAVVAVVVVSNPFANEDGPEVMDGNRCCCDMSGAKREDVGGIEAIWSDKTLILFWIPSAM